MAKYTYSHLYNRNTLAIYMYGNIEIDPYKENYNYKS